VLLENCDRLLSRVGPPYRQGMASNRSELGTLKKLLSEADLILSPSSLP
jgi:hypothetical protein